MKRLDSDKNLAVIYLMRWFLNETRCLLLFALTLAVSVSIGCAWRPSLPKFPDFKFPAIKLPNFPDLNPFNDEIGGPAPDESIAVEIVEGGSDVEGFQVRASSFYESLANRRFNSVITYTDESLRSYFRDSEEFDSYYSDLAFSLQAAFFSRSRPLRLKVREFSQEEIGVAAVEILFVGDDSRALRSGETDLVRIDRWERHDGEWWLVPGKV